MTRKKSGISTKPVDISFTGLVEMLDFFLVVVFVLKFINKARFPQNVSIAKKILLLIRAQIEENNDNF